MQRGRAGRGCEAPSCQVWTRASSSRLGQSVTSRASIINRDDSERELQNQVKTRSLAAASTAGMTGSFSLFAPGGAKRAGVGCHRATNRFDKTTTVMTGKKKKKNWPHYWAKTCVPQLLIRNFSYVTTVCEPSDIASNVLSDLLTLWTQFSLRN